MHSSGLPLFARGDLAGFTAPPNILLAVNGDVFDVTELGSVFYGPGAGYSLFAGHDATRALTLGSLDQEDLAKGGDCSDFNEARLGELRGQHEFYLGKYVLVGKVLGRSGVALDGVIAPGAYDTPPPPPPVDST